MKEENDYRLGNNIYLVNINDPSNRVVGCIENTNFSIGHSQIDCAVNQLVMEPIRITNEILVKNGFVQRKASDKFSFPSGTETFYLAHDVEADNYFISMDVQKTKYIRLSIPLTYIHELQNAAYYIRGKEIKFRNL